MASQPRQAHSARSGRPQGRRGPVAIFDAIPTYPRYRTLRLTDHHQHGEDVWALQTALLACGFPLPKYGADGDFGKETSLAVIKAQQALSLTVDGLAGGRTQEGLAMRLGAAAQHEWGLPDGSMKGQLQHESGFRLGNYSDLRPDGSFDAGVAQRNTKLTPAKQGFDVPESINELGKVVRGHWDMFVGVKPSVRRWALAQGSWNAPAFACWIAREEGATDVPRSLCAQPGRTARAAFEAYVASVSAYL